MRAIWSGSVTFGLVNISVKAYSASQERPFDFDLLHRKDLEPIHYKKVCGAGHPVQQADIVKGYKLPDGHYVVLDKEDFEKANSKKTHAIEIQSFTDQDEIDAVYYERPYYLEADKGSDRPYALLNEALRQTGKVAVATFVFRQHENLGVVMPHGKGLILNQLRFHADLRADDLEYPAVKAQKGELAMAVRLIESQSEKFNPKAYKDTYHDELLATIRAKGKGHPIKVKGEIPKPTNVIDLMAALEKSLKSVSKTRKASPRVTAHRRRHA